MCSSSGLRNTVFQIFFSRFADRASRYNLSNQPTWCTSSCFIISLLYSSTCFEHYVLIVRVEKHSVPDFFFHVLLNVHLSIILVINQLNIQILVLWQVYCMPPHVSSTMCSSSGLRNTVFQMFFFFHVLLTVHLGIILVINQLNTQILLL